MHRSLPDDWQKRSSQTNLHKTMLAFSHTRLEYTTKTPKRPKSSIQGNLAMGGRVPALLNQTSYFKNQASCPRHAKTVTTRMRPIFVGHSGLSTPWASKCFICHGRRPIQTKHNATTAGPKLSAARGATPLIVPSNETSNR